MEHLIEMIERVWPLNNVKIGALQDSSGADVYCLEATQGAFMLKFLSASIDAAQASRNTFVLDYLEKCNFPAPRIIVSCDDQLFSHWNGRYVYLLRYIEGRIIEENEKEEYELGRMAARLHKIANYPYPTSLVSKKTLLSCLHGSPIKTDYDNLLLSLPDFSKDSQVLIHTDLCPSNAIWTKDNELVLIDFDNAGMGAKALDIGYPLISQFIDFEGRLPMQLPSSDAKLKFKQNIAKAFYSGYFADAIPGKAEREQIFNGAIYRMLQELSYLPQEAIGFRWKTLQYALDNKDVILRTLSV